MWLISASVWNKSVPHMSFCPYFCRCSISRRTWIRLWCTIWRLLRLPKTSPGRVNREKMIEINSLSSPVLIKISLKFLKKNNQEEKCICQRLLFRRSVDLWPKYSSLFTHTQRSAYSAHDANFIIRRVRTYCTHHMYLETMRYFISGFVPNNNIYLK